VPLGLAANEALTNCFKHATKGKTNGLISVSLTTELGSGDLKLTVSDNGPGLKEGGRTGSQGLKLIRSLTNQLSGRVDIDSSESGTRVTLIFPRIE
jgi:two-component sensor histidine kinase